MPHLPPAGLAQGFLQALAQGTNLGLVLLDRSLKIVWHNERFAGLPGHSAGGYLGRGLTTATTKYGDAILPALERVLATGRAELDIELGQPPFGAGRPHSPWRVSIVPVAGMDQGAAGLGVIIEDAAPIQDAEAALWATLADHRAVLQACPLPVVGLMPDGRVASWNLAAERTFGWTEAEVLHQPLPCVPPDKADEYRRLRMRVLAGQPFHGYETWRVRRDGSRFPVSISTAPRYDLRGEISGLVAIYEDITERRASEAALRASEAEYRLLFEGNPNPTWVCDRETLRVLAVNAAAIELYGYSREEFLAMTIQDLRATEEPAREPSARPGESLAARATLSRHRTKSGTAIEVEISAQSLVFGGRQAELVLAHDVTHQRQLEQQLLQAQKMEAVGRLAGGIAHDFNNILSAIMGYAELVYVTFPAGDTRRDDVGEIARAAERAAALTGQLLAFSRQQVLAPRLLDLNEVVTGIENLLRRIIGEDIQLETRLAPHLGRVLADPNQLGQVVLNLAVNARDAMPDGGTLTLETADAELDETYALQQPLVTPGRFVVLSVSDTGVGMTPEQQARIFEPFFTTKQPGKGTGLGLSTVYGIVKQSGGFIWVYSEPGYGAAFKIYLPQAEAMEEQVGPPVPVATRSGGGETILLVEDDLAVADVAARLLEKEGYTVLRAETAEQALAMVGAASSRVDLVLTDVVMPGKSGLDLAEQLRGVRPAVAVLLMSGYTERGAAPRRPLPADTAFLEKPFTRVALTGKVRELLDARGPTAER